MHTISKIYILSKIHSDAIFDNSVNLTTFAILVNWWISQFSEFDYFNEFREFRKIGNFDDFRKRLEIGEFDNFVNVVVKTSFLFRGNYGT